jgi:hypothetical protein
MADDASLGAAAATSAGASCGIGGGATPPPAVATPARGAWGELGSILFGIDTRSLAAFRVAIALILLVDLWFRAGGLTAFYTDAGLLTRAELKVADNGDPWHLSLHVFSGAAWYEGTLFALAAGFALMLLVGWRTRLAGICSWALLISLQSRNPQVLQGGDVLLRCLLFWGMLLPLGASWSIDRARAPRQELVPRRVANVASMALLLQMCFLYWFAALLKTHAEWRSEHTAVYYALSIDQLATPFGHWLRQYREMLKALTAATWWQEGFGPFLAFIPALPLAAVSLRAAAIAAGWGRLILVVLFVGFHLGLASTMELGPFPFVCWAGWLPFLPALFWDGLIDRWSAKRQGLQIWYDGDCGFCMRMARLMQTFWLLPKGTTVRACQEDPEMERIMREEDSWVVVAPDGGRRTRWDGLATVMRFSPIMRPFSVLARLPPALALGTWAYRRVARNRGTADRFLWFMKERPLRPLPGPRLQFVLDALAAVLLYYVVLWNWRTTYIGKDFDEWANRWYPTSENWILEIPRLDQYWSMFSPMPLHDDGWYLAPATLADGSTVDLLTGLPPTDAQPQRVSALYHDERWRKYLMNLYSTDFAPWRKNYARWLAERWNERHAPEKQVRKLELFFWKKTNRYDGEPTMSKDRLAEWPETGH